MRMRASLWMALLVLLASLAGCTGGDADPADDGTDDGADDSDGSDGGDDSDGGDGTDDGAEANLTYELTFNASAIDGEVPLNVTFNASLEAFDDDVPVETGDFSWALNPGDGSDDLQGDQADFPLGATHQYQAAGDYNAILRVTVEDDQVLSQNLTISAILGEAPVEAPQTTFELGPTLGCTGDDAAGTCIGIVVATELHEVMTIDGHFISLDDRYRGATMVMTASIGGQAIPDTDCYFLDEAFTIIGNGHNGADVCTGTVPKDTAWAFVFPYGASAESVLVEFTL